MSNLWDYPDCVWAYRESTWTLDRDLLGYAVHVSDSCIGHVLRVENGPLGAYIVVDASAVRDTPTLVPAGLVAALDHDRRLVQLSLTEDQVRRAPRHDSDEWNDTIRAQLTDYYSKVNR